MMNTLKRNLVLYDSYQKRKLLYPESPVFDHLNIAKDDKKEKDNPEKKKGFRRIYGEILLQRKMKVELIFPSISGIGFDSFGKGMEESWISHGLCLISAYAKKHGFNPGLIDLRRLKGWEHFAEEIKRRSPDAVGITMMSVDYNPAMKCIKIIKEISP